MYIPQRQLLNCILEAVNVLLGNCSRLLPMLDFDTYQPLYFEGEESRKYEEHPHDGTHDQSEPENS